MMGLAAIKWLEKNTTIDTSQDPLPPDIQLFIEKYKELMSLRAGVTQEGISGLSQSFKNQDIGALLRQYAVELIGENNMVPTVKGIPGEDRWTY